jgi:two-component system, NtrC family, sensor kinase
MKRRATARYKAAKAPRRKIRSCRAATPSGDHRSSDATLQEQLDQSRDELKEALEHQTATREVLDLISRTPTDVQPVFSAIAESAARLCNALFGVVWRYDGELLHYAASHNFTPQVLNHISKTYPKKPDRQRPGARYWTAKLLMCLICLRIGSTLTNWLWRGIGELRYRFRCYTRARR